MSLEQALQQNTEALNRLADVIRAAGLATCATEHPQEKSAPSPPAATKVAKEEAAAAFPSELTYADIQKPFLKLVNANRDKAVALLAELGAPTLQTFKDKPEKFASILAKIQEASA